MNIPADNDTILLVDDEPGICTVLGISLTDIGYTVHTANDGDEALRIFHQQQPSIVLTDIKMPGMDGIDLLKKIRAIDRNVPVLMFSAKADTDNVRDGMDLGIAAFIPKLSPFADTQANLRVALDMVFKQKLK